MRSAFAESLLDVSIVVQKREREDKLHLSYSLNGCQNILPPSQDLDVEFSEDFVLYGDNYHPPSLASIESVNVLGVRGSFFQMTFADKGSAICVVKQFFNSPKPSPPTAISSEIVQAHVYSAFASFLIEDNICCKALKTTQDVMIFLQVMQKYTCSVPALPSHGALSMILHICVSVCDIKSYPKLLKDIFHCFEPSLFEKINLIYNSLVISLSSSSFFCSRVLVFLHEASTKYFVSGSNLDNACSKLVQDSFIYTNLYSPFNSLHFAELSSKAHFMELFKSHFQKLAESKCNEERILEAFLEVVNRFESMHSSSRNGPPLHIAVLELFPPPIRVAIYTASCSGFKFAQKSWPDWLLHWVGRKDLIHSKCQIMYAPSVDSYSSTDVDKYANDKDGLSVVEKSNNWRFPDDERLLEVSRILRASVPYYLRVEKAPESNDSLHTQNQQMKLLTLCRRALSSAVGRGMFTIDSYKYSFQPGDKIPISYTCLSGRVPKGSTNAIIRLNLSNASPDLTFWPDFHAGVAAGLR